MKPQTLSTQRRLLMQIMTVVGICLFVLIGIRAVRQISDKQYIVGKPRTTSPSTTIGNPTFVQTAANTSFSTLPTASLPAQSTPEVSKAEDKPNPYPTVTKEVKQEKTNSKKNDNTQPEKIKDDLIDNVKLKLR